MTVTRVAASRSRYLIGAGARRIGEASRAGGAGESGLTKLIWAHAAHYTSDAMIAVCLAGTIFFSAARSEQRTQVALYLLVTMAPFAIVAPFIGPALDRMQRGRRLALAATALSRGILAWVMAAEFHNGFALYPAAFGALVLSKAYAVLKGACLPRVLPRGLTLVSANARMSMFGLAAAAIGAGGLAGIIHLSGSYPLALRITAVFCLGAAILSLRLPAAVDSAEGEQPVSPAALTRTGPIGRRAGSLSLGPHVVTALRASAALRGLSGFLTLFLAFWIQSTETGTTAALALAGLVAGASVGTVVGTAIGARMPMKHPDPVLLGSIGVVAGISVVAALSFGLGTALRRRRRGRHRQRTGQALPGRDHPARGAGRDAGLGVRPVRDAAAAGLGGRWRARRRAAVERHARLRGGGRAAGRRVHDHPAGPPSPAHPPGPRDRTRTRAASRPHALTPAGHRAPRPFDMIAR